MPTPLTTPAPDTELSLDLETECHLLSGQLPPEHLTLRLLERPGPHPGLQGALLRALQENPDEILELLGITDNAAWDQLRVLVLELLVTQVIPDGKIRDTELCWLTRALCISPSEERDRARNPGRNRTELPTSAGARSLQVLTQLAPALGRVPDSRYEQVHSALLYPLYPYRTAAEMRQAGAALGTILRPGAGLEREIDLRGTALLETATAARRVLHEEAPQLTLLRLMRTLKLNRSHDALTALIDTVGLEPWILRSFPDLHLLTLPFEDALAHTAHTRRSAGWRFWVTRNNLLNAGQHDRLCHAAHTQRWQGRNCWGRQTFSAHQPSENSSGCSIYSGPAARTREELTAALLRTPHPLLGKEILLLPEDERAQLMRDPALRLPLQTVRRHSWPLRNAHLMTTGEIDEIGRITLHTE